MQLCMYLHLQLSVFGEPILEKINPILLPETLCTTKAIYSIKKEAEGIAK